MAWIGAVSPRSQRRQAPPVAKLLALAAIDKNVTAVRKATQLLKRNNLDWNDIAQRLSRGVQQKNDGLSDFRKWADAEYERRAARRR